MGAAQQRNSHHQGCGALHPTADALALALALALGHPDVFDFFAVIETGELLEGVGSSFVFS